MDRIWYLNKVLFKRFQIALYYLKYEIIESIEIKRKRFSRWLRLLDTRHSAYGNAYSAN